MVGLNIRIYKRGSAACFEEPFGERTLTNPQSITKRIPSIVTLASAILVERTTLRDPFSEGSNTLSWSAVDSPACSESTFSRLALAGNLAMTLVTALTGKRRFES